MEKEALIRYACVTSPGMDSDGLAWPYLEAAIATGLGVRVMPIGLAAMWLAPWNGVPQVFLSALKTRFINVVCVPAGLAMGAPVSAAQFGNAKASEEAAYKPPMALHGLFTVGIPNVAILPDAERLSQTELETLKLYTEVICPSSEGVTALKTQGVRAVEVPPDPRRLAKLFSGMNPA